MCVFKIEGRARSADYVKTTVACYREAADAVCAGTFTPELARALRERLATVFNRGFWDGYYLGAPMGEWSGIYGSHATRRKVYVGKVTNWYARLNVVEIQVEATDLHRGDTLLFIGHKTGALEVPASEIRVDLKPCEVARQGELCSVPVPPECQPADPSAQGGEDRLHPRRSDKVYLWTTN